MKLISCPGCGVVLNQDNLKFAEDMNDDEGCIDYDKARYNQDTREYCLYVPCPVCKAEIFKE